MRVIFLSQFWYPEVGAPQTRLGEWAKYLKEAGVNVSVLTGQPNYPTGKIYSGYSGWRWTKEEIEGVKVIRCPIFATKAKRTLPRLVSYLSFALSSAVRGLSLVTNTDVLLVESPPLFTALPARLLASVRGCKYVFNVSDLWPDSAIEMNWLANQRAISLARWLERWAYDGAAALTGQAPSIIKALKERTKSKPLKLLTNGVDTTRFVEGNRQSLRERLGFSSNQVIAIYAGLHGVAQGLEQILGAASRLRRQPHLRFLFVGDGPEKESLLAQAKKLELGNVRFLDPVPSRDIPDLLAAADIAIVSLRFPLTGAVPSKIYEGMAAGLPVIFVGEGDGVLVIQENQAGLCCRIGDSAALDEALLALLRDPGMRKALGCNGKKAVARSYSRASSASQLYELVMQVAKNGCPIANSNGVPR